MITDNTERTHYEVRINIFEYFNLRPDTMVDPVIVSALIGLAGLIISPFIYYALSKRRKNPRSPQSKQKKGSEIPPYIQESFTIKDDDHISRDLGERTSKDQIRLSLISSQPVDVYILDSTNADKHDRGKTFYPEEERDNVTKLNLLLDFPRRDTYQLHFTNHSKQKRAR